jgi:3-deoxy-7-phosphoheptulonate synthase
VDLLSRAVNQVACQIGSAMTPAELLDPCNRLDPYREPGKLTLIVRMGAGVIADRLPALARAVRDDGHPALWLSDPMHGNTIKRADGGKTRAVSTIVDEVSQFLSCLDEAGLMAHGVHLEASPYAARECVWGSGDALPPPAAPATGAPTLCDPRLDAEQAAEVVSAWWRAGYAHPRPF